MRGLILRAIVLRSCLTGRAVACDCAALLRGRSCVAAWFVVFVLHSCACAGIILDTSHVPELGRAIVLRSCVAGRAWPRLRAIVLRSCVAGRAWPYEVACDCAALLRGRSCVAACCVAGVSSLHSCACAVILCHMIFKQCARARAWAWTRCCGGSGCFPAPSGCSTGARLLFRRAAFRGVPAVFFVGVDGVQQVVMVLCHHTSSIAQGGGGSFKNRKPIGEVGCCESRMAEHWWTERCLRSPLFLSLSLTIYLPTYLSSMYLSIYRSIDRSISLSLSFI